MITVMDYNPQYKIGTCEPTDEQKTGRQAGRPAAFLRVGYQWINVKIQLENHHLSTIILTDSGKNYQRILKLVGKSLLRNRIFT